MGERPELARIAAARRNEPERPLRGEGKLCPNVRDKAQSGPTAFSLPVTGRSYAGG